MGPSHLTDPQYETRRTQLLDLLLERAILRQTTDQPILGRDQKTTAPWMLDSLNVSLTQAGADLAADCLLHLLARFDGRQLATFGLIGVPLLQSCVLKSGGRYWGLLLRAERKPYGACRQIEGPADPREPVILVDDSVSSGHSMREGIRILEEAGFRVEGGVSLARFYWETGFSELLARGYHLETLFDVWTDFVARLPEYGPIHRNPTRRTIPQGPWTEERAAEGLTPTALARSAMSTWLTTHCLLSPPGHLDQDYGADGGVFVSVRDRQQMFTRYARDGFWRFADEPAADPGRDIVLAAAKTAQSLPAREAGIARLEQSAVSVTLLGPLMPCEVGQLDNEKFGLVVQSIPRPTIMGGALPRMPGIPDTWAQFQHARINNARLELHEPFRIFRHDLTKVVEPDCAWPAGGIPREPGNGPGPLPDELDESWGAQLARRAGQQVCHYLGLASAPAGPDPEMPVSSSLDSIYLALYRHGQLVACPGCRLVELGSDLERLARRAANELRAAGPFDPDAIATTISLLFQPQLLGEQTGFDVEEHFFLGRHALMVAQGERVGLLLPEAAGRGDRDAKQFVAELLQQAGITKGTAHWARFECMTWLLHSDGSPLRLCGPVPDPTTQPSPPLSLDQMRELLTNYLLAQQQPDGSWVMEYNPFEDRARTGEHLGWWANGAWALARMARASGRTDAWDAAERAVARLLPLVRDEAGQTWLVGRSQPPAISEVAMLLLALRVLDQHPDLREQLTATLWAQIDGHGKIHTHSDRQISLDAYQDYFPGQALLALAAAPEHLPLRSDPDRIVRALAFYRHRFRFKRHWGPVGWLPQALAAWWRITGDPQWAEAAFGTVDWALTHQQETTGGFINDHVPDVPGALTGVYLEGVTAAHRLARAVDDAHRFERYTRVAQRGFAFLDRLLLQDRDRPLLPHLERARGGLRVGLYRGQTRPDLAQHTLSALLTFTTEET